MSENNMINPEHISFESLKVTNEQGGEIWLERQLGKVLDY